MTTFVAPCRYVTTLNGKITGFADGEHVLMLDMYNVTGIESTFIESIKADPAGIMLKIHGPGYTPSSDLADRPIVADGDFVRLRSLFEEVQPTTP